MLENPDFEQNYWSRTAASVYETGHDSIRLMKLLSNYDRSYHDNLNYFILMGSFCENLKEISQRCRLPRSKRSSISCSSN